MMFFRLAMMSRPMCFERPSAYVDQDASYQPRQISQRPQSREQRLRVPPLRFGREGQELTSAFQPVRSRGAP